MVIFLFVERLVRSTDEGKRGVRLGQDWALKWAAEKREEDTAFNEGGC